MNIQFINFFSLKRSGHHAIIHWLRQILTGRQLNTHEQINEVCFFINEMNKEKKFRNVYKKVTETEIIAETETINSWALKEYDKIKTWLKQQAALKWFLSNYEDASIFKCADLYHINNIIVIRDFLNCISSRYKHTIFKEKTLKDTNSLLELIQLWKDHIQSVNNVKILYNSWVVSSEYRHQILRELNIQDNHNFIDNLNIEPHWGGGSSFKYEKEKKERVRYFERYKQIILPDKYRETILQDKELIELNKQHFNIDIPSVINF